jgi:hypothetical protein
MDIQIVSSATRINTFLKIQEDFYNIFRIDLTSGTCRVTAAQAPTQSVSPIENIHEYGATCDGVVCKIAQTISKDEIRKMIRKRMNPEDRKYATKDLTTDGYYPAIILTNQQALGLKRRGDTFEGYRTFAKPQGYQPLITDQCYFSEAFRLLMPLSMLMKHLIENLGWIADPYDWQEFEWQEKKRWVEFPEMKRDDAGV